MQGLNAVSDQFTRPAHNAEFDRAVLKRFYALGTIRMGVISGVNNKVRFH